MDEIKEILINNKQYIEMGREVKMPKYVKDLADGWVGKLDIDRMLYADKNYEETIDFNEVVRYINKEEYRVVGEKDYDDYFYNMRLEEIKEKIDNNNNEIKNLQEENKKLEQEEQEILHCINAIN